MAVRMRTWGRWIGVRGHAFGEDGRSSPRDFAHANVEQKDRGLEDIEADQLSDQIAAGNDVVEAGHHQENDDPVVVQTEERTHGRSSAGEVAEDADYDRGDGNANP